MGACQSNNAVPTPTPVPVISASEAPVSQEKVLEEIESAPVVVTVDAKRACFGAGCYWGTEKYFSHDFGKKNQTGAIADGRVGFMGPKEAPVDPTYAEVKGGYTTHVEVYEFEFSGGREYYEALVRFFFQFHDPTTFKRQGNDVGTQYASVIYCYDQAQFDIATKVKAELQKHIDDGKITCFEGKTVTTDIRTATVFYTAHPEHQDYLEVNPNGYCNHRIRFPEWPAPSPAASTETAPEVVPKVVQEEEVPVKEEQVEVKLEVEGTETTAQQ